MSNAKKNMTPCPSSECAPCPSCGGTSAVAVAIEADGVPCWQVHCPVCHARGPRMLDRPAAVDKWSALSGYKDAAERIALAPELFARYALGPEAVCMLRHLVPLAAHPIATANVDAEHHRRALAAIDHCADIASKALDR